MNPRRTEVCQFGADPSFGADAYASLRMRTASFRRTLSARMGEHHAIWANLDKPTSLYAGKLVVSEAGLQLDGAGPGGAWIAEIPRAEIAQVGRARGRLRLGGRPWVRLDLRNGGTLLIGSVLGAKALSDLLDAIASLLS